MSAVSTDGDSIAASRQIERLLQIRFGGDQMTAVGQCPGQIRERSGHSVAVERMLLAPDGDRLLEQRDRAIAQALPPVGKSDALEQLRPHLGLQS